MITIATPGGASIDGVEAPVPVGRHDGIVFWCGAYGDFFECFCRCSHASVNRLIHEITPSLASKGEACQPKQSSPFAAAGAVMTTSLS